MGRTINPSTLAQGATENPAMAPQVKPPEASPVPPVDENADNNNPPAVGETQPVADHLGPIPPRPNIQLSEAEEIAGMKKGDKGVVHNPNSRPMRDPHTKDYFPPGEHVRVKEAGNWTIMQIGAGVLLPGNADLIGEKPKKDDGEDE